MKVDMSPEAVTIRLKRVSQLRRLCLELGKMKPVVSIETADSDDEVSGKQPAISLVNSVNRKPATF
jgi:hypothetical protein